MPSNIVGQPALHERSSGIPGAAADAQQVGDPGEAVPGREPVLPGFGREPDRHRVVYELPRQQNLAAQDRVAALGVARPTLGDTQPQIRGDAADQRVTIERAGGEGA
jgi:hypothetical protein